MARRSYLSRIAQPLTAADPAVWSTPRASADEARPVAQAGRATPTPPTAPAVSTRPQNPRHDIVRPPQYPCQPSVAAIAPRGEASRPASPSRAAPSEPGHATPAPVNLNREWDAGSTGPFDEEAWPHAASSAPVRPIAVDDAPAMRAQTPTPAAEARADASPNAERAILTERTSRPIGFDPFDDEVSPPDRAAPPRALRQGVPTARASDPAPRLHIGAIEIRMTTPPPAPVAPPPVIMHAPPEASAPLARAYASRFGLAQS